MTKVFIFSELRKRYSFENSRDILLLAEVEGIYDDKYITVIAENIGTFKHPEYEYELEIK